MTTTDLDLAIALARAVYRAACDAYSVAAGHYYDDYERTPAFVAYYDRALARRDRAREVWLAARDGSDSVGEYV